MTTTIAQSTIENSDSDINTISNNHEDKLSSNESESKNDDIFTANLSELNNIFYEHVKKYMETSMYDHFYVCFMFTIYFVSIRLYDFTIVCQEYVNQCKAIKENKSSPGNIHKFIIATFIVFVYI